MPCHAVWILIRRKEKLYRENYHEHVFNMRLLGQCILCSFSLNCLNYIGTLFMFKNIHANHNIMSKRDLTLYY